MSIIECGDCGKEISSHAARCVHCGFPLPENRPGVKWGRYIALGLVVLASTSAIILNRGTIVEALKSARTAYAAPERDSARPGGTPGTAPGLSPAPQAVASAAVCPKKTPDPAAIIRRVITRDKEIFAAFKALDYEHYWTAGDLDIVARCEADRKELLYGLASLHLIDQNPDYEQIVHFLQMENRVAMAVIAYYEDLIPSKYTRPATPLFVQRLQKAFVEIRQQELKLEKFGWTRAYAEWGIKH